MPILRIAAIGTLAVGIVLRVYRYPEMLVFSDEVHALVTAAEHGYGWILRHFTPADSCIPLTLYDRALLDLGLLSETTLRLPTVLAGVGVLIVLWRALPRWCGPATGLVVLGIVALSPWVIFGVREARPYPVVMLLFTGAVALRLRAEQRPRALHGAAALLALATWFHPVTLVSSGVLLAEASWATRPGGPLAAARRRALEGLAVFAGLCVALVGPALGSLLASVLAKGAGGSAGLGTASDALAVLLRAPSVVPVASWIVAPLCILGAVSGVLRERALGRIALALLAAQVLFLYLLQPEYLEIPWVLLRYFAHLVPLLVLLGVAGVVALLRPLGARLARPERAAALAAILLCVAYAGAQAASGGYRHLRSNFNTHPAFFWLSPADFDLPPLRPTFDFYARLGQEAGGSILEVPHVPSLAIHSLHQRLHQRPVRAVALSEGYGQGVFATAGAHFDRVRPLASALPDSDHDLVVVHKQVKREMALWFQHLSRLPATARHLAPLAPLFDARGLAAQLPADPLAELRPFQRELGPVVYEDRFIRVHRGGAAAAPPAQPTQPR